ncbi:MAG: serine protease Do, partial [Planctomycetota bacterium]
MKARIAFKSLTPTFFVIFCLISSLTTAQVDQAAKNRRRSPVVLAVEKIGPSVVSINTQKLVNRRSLFGDVFDFGDADTRSRNGRYQNYSLGSGVIIDEKGYVVTNDHVVQRADIITVSLPDGREFPATLIGSDIQNDIAILKVHSDTRLPAASLGRSHDLLLGESTIAVGNPFGLGGSVTAGIVSAINRTVNFRNKKKFTDFIQTSAVINPGNSGGPLININGDVIGINVAIHSRGPGIGFAIPISRVREVVYSVLDPRISKEAVVGIDIDHLHEGSGAMVRAVDRNGPASETGLASGDKILAVNNQRIEDWIDFQTTVQELKVGD